MAIHRSISQDDWNRLHERLTAVENGLGQTLRHLNDINEKVEANTEARAALFIDVANLITQVDDIHTTVDGITQADDDGSDIRQSNPR